MVARRDRSRRAGGLQRNARDRACPPQAVNVMWEQLPCALPLCWLPRIVAILRGSFVAHAAWSAIALPSRAQPRAALLLC